MTKYRTFPNYKTATQSILKVTPLPRKGYTTFDTTPYFTSILVDTTKPHPSHITDSLTKLHYTITVSDEMVEHIKTKYGHGQPILIIAKNPKSAFTNKLTNNGFYTFSSFDEDTNTLQLTYSHH